METRSVVQTLYRGRSPMAYPHRGPAMRSFRVALFVAWTSCWRNSRDSGESRPLDAHVTAMHHADIIQAYFIVHTDIISLRLAVSCTCQQIILACHQICDISLPNLEKYEDWMWRIYIYSNYFWYQNNASGGIVRRVKSVYSAALLFPWQHSYRHTSDEAEIPLTGHQGACQTGT